eukprot:scaffold5358_cov69-Skeletonema_menzelii.AAC.2
MRLQQHHLFSTVILIKSPSYSFYSLQSYGGKGGKSDGGSSIGKGFTFFGPIPPEDNVPPKEKRQLQNQPSCSVCGEGKKVGNPDAAVSFPGQAGQIPCGTLENMGLDGLIPLHQCKVLPQLISTVCECESILTYPPTTQPSTSKASKSPKAKGAKTKNKL